MFQTVGVEEFKFIKRSGAYFGLLFGIVQMFVWVLYPAWWVLPFFGFLVGYVTNWLALKLIFEPAEPKQVGPFTLQGLFHKRQEPVARVDRRGGGSGGGIAMLARFGAGARGPSRLSARLRARSRVSTARAWQANSRR